MSKSTGIIRQLDELGRIVIPKEIRKSFNIQIKDPIEISTYRNTIILKKYVPNCIFCSSSKKLIEYERQLICKECCEKLKNTI